MTNRTGLPARQRIETIAAELRRERPALTVQVATNARVIEVAKRYGLPQAKVAAHISGERTDLAPWVCRRIEAELGIEQEGRR